MFDMEIDKSRLEKALRIAPQELKKELWDEFDHINRSFLSTFRKTRLQGPPGIYGDGRKGLFGTFGKRRFGSMAKIEDMGMEIYSSSKTIGPRHQFGIPLIAQKDHLLIPFRANTATREKMYTSGKKPRVRKKFQDASKVKGLFSMKIKGEEYLAKRYGPKVVLMYIKKKRAEYKDALGFYETWNAFVPKAITYMNRAVEKALARI